MLHVLLGLLLVGYGFSSSLRTITGGASGTTHGMLPSPGGVVERRQSYILYAAKVPCKGVSLPI